MSHTLHRLTAAFVVPLAALAFAGCDDDDDPTGVDPDPVVTFESSFEQSMAGFEVDTTHMDHPPVDWSVERSDARASEGSSAMRIQIDNVNDRAKVWLERSFDDLEPNTIYDVEVSYAFASADWGMVNLWNVFVGAHPTSPDEWADFANAVVQETGNGASEDEGFIWDDRSAQLSTDTGDDGSLHVAIGIWGTWETLRTYFIDDVRVTITPR